MTAAQTPAAAGPAPASPAPPREPGVGAHGEWYWAMPELAVMFFVLAIIAFLWLVDRQEREQARNSLISDILWLEQNVRFHLQSNEYVMALLAREAGEGRLDEDGFRVRAAHLLGSNPELLHVALVDAAGNLRAAAPGGAGEWRAGRPPPGTDIGPALRLAAASGRRVYGELRLLEGDAGFDVVVPVLRGGEPGGAVVGRYSTAGIVRHLVPWWFAQKYEVGVFDKSGALVSARSAVAATNPELNYQIPLDPPGHGLILRASAYGGGASFGERMFTWLILGLTVAILWSLWMLRRHVLRRELAEEALRASHERFTMVLEGLEAAVSVRDRVTRESLYCNGRFRDLFGPAQAEGAFCPLAPWQARGSADEELDLDLQDMESGRWYHLQSRPVRWVDERLVQLDLATDITERKEAEELSRQQMEKLQFTSRLVTMGEMASSLAHELNQPLSAIASYNTGCLNTLRSGVGDPAALLEAVEKVGAQAQRAGRIIKGIHEFVRKSEPQRAPCDLNAVVEEALGFIQPEARKRGVQLELRLDPDLPGVMADRVMLEQVVMNLAKNAVEAMAGAERRELTVATSRTAEGHARVSVADTGPGITPSLREKLFAPFFTTKPEGMGMGLNICRSIVEYHQGRLWIDANPGGGSVFSFTLPS